MVMPSDVPASNGLINKSLLDFPTVDYELLNSNVSDNNYNHFDVFGMTPPVQDRLIL